MKSKSFNEVALHTILATCRLPHVMGLHEHSHMELLESRLNKIERIAEIRVRANAKAAIARSIEHNKKGE